METSKNLCGITHKGSYDMRSIPMPYEIDAVIFDMIAAEAAQALTTPVWTISGRAENFVAMASATHRLKRERAHESLHN